jgi:flagellar basal-body rod protein FlgB
MPSPIESMTTAALSAALDAASLRQALVAANIANAGTEGYLPLRLSFEARLDEVRAALRDGGWLDPASLETLRGLGEGEVEVRAGTDPVRLDAEMAELARNAVEFQALVQGVSRHLSLLALAAADGRR